jgi:hypothetical protein
LTGTTFPRRLAKVADKFSFLLFKHPGLGRAIRTSLDVTGRWHQRSCPLNAPLVVALTLLLVLERSLSIGRVLNLGLRLLRNQDDSDPVPQVTREALCHARKRLGVEPLKALFEHTAALVRPRRTFHGLRVWAIDTVDMRLLDSPANVDRFGRPGAVSQAGFPQIGASVLLDVAGRQVRDVILSDITDSERALAIPLVRHLGRGDLLLQDRGIAGVWVLHSYRAQKLDFLTRIPKSWKPRIVKRLGQGDYLVELSGVLPVALRESSGITRPPRRVTIQARLIEYRLPDGQRVRLITSLTDPTKYPAMHIAREYHQRWDIEIAFDELKTHLATVLHGTTRTIFRSKSPNGVLQEAYALFAAYNLIRQLIERAARKRRIDPLQISFVESLDYIRWTMFEIVKTCAQRRQLVDRLLDDVSSCRIDRPRRPRICPRAVKVKTSRYDKKQPADKERPNLAPLSLALVNRYSTRKRAA